MKKTILAAIAIVLTVALLLSCAPAAQGGESGETASFKMNEPECLGDAGNGKPMFRLSWDKYPDADGYEVALYAEGTDPFTGEDFAVRSTKSEYSDDTQEMVIVMLQGVYTDTVRYRVKVRPGTDVINDPGEAVWSNLWEINFVDGEYTVSATEEDFDLETAEALPESKEEEIDAPKPEIKEPLNHSYPETLLDYLARESGEDTPFAAEDIGSFIVGIDHCEYGEPVQKITDSVSVEQFRKAVGAVKVTGKEDDIASTETYIYFNALDENGYTMFYFAIQSGLLVGGDGRYGVEGTDGLFSIDGVRYENDWDNYWDELEEKQREYEDANPVRQGMPVLDAAGYMTHLMSGSAPDCVDYITAYIDWNQEAGRLDTDDRAEIEALMNALSKVTVGAEENSPEGQMWHINFTFQGEDPTISSSAYLAMQGQCVKIGDDYYRAEGLEDFLSAVDNDMFKYILDHPDAKKIDPSY